MKQKLVKYIVERLEKDADQLRTDFQNDNEIKTRFTTIDNLLPEEIARKIFIAYPSFAEMRLLESFREKKIYLENFGQIQSAYFRYNFCVPG